LNFSERLREIRTGFERPFWVANITEIFERLSYYGAFASLALYLQEKLNFSTEQTGTLTGIFGGMVWFLAIFGGAAADRMGFRRALSIAYLILAVAYFLIGSIGASWLAPVRNAIPLGLFVGFILILPALGISLVKPSVVGTTARASKESVRSIGYSIYYTMVNIGGAAGPYFASWAHRHLGVENVYRVAALSVFAMFFVVLFLRCRGKLSAGLTGVRDCPAAAHRHVLASLHRALVDLDRTSAAGAGRDQPVHVVSGAVHWLLGCVLAAVHQPTRLHSRIHKCQR
jgi:POT family proton-dependent oligopeptide transporter